jgi:ethanolamine-phosphate cytidylyltransferase
VHKQVDLVCHGDTNVAPDVDGSDPYEEPKKQGKFKVVSSGNALTTEKLVQRIVERRLDYENRNAKKEQKELAAYEAFQRQKRLEKEEER